MTCLLLVFMPGYGWTLSVIRTMAYTSTQITSVTPTTTTTTFSYMESKSGHFVRSNRRLHHYSTNKRTPSSLYMNRIDNYETFGDAALSNETFAQHFPRLPRWLCVRAEECGWKYPTLIQSRAIEAALNGNDVIIHSQTGSGKTLGYILPLLASIDPSRSSIQGIIVVPTRELGVQVARVARRLAAGSVSSSSNEVGEKIMIMSVLQGSGNKRQRAWARADPPHVVIGTPRELGELVKRGGMKYHAVRFVVVDEVDACLLNNAGTLNLSASGPLHELLSRYLSPTFEEAVLDADLLPMQVGDDKGSNRVISHGTDRQTVFVSATIPQKNHFLKQCVQNQWMVREPVYICASPGELIPPTLKHVYVVCDGMEQKMVGLIRMIHKEMDKTFSEKTEIEGAFRYGDSVRIIIFCEPKRNLEKMQDILQKELVKRLSKSFDVSTSVLRYDDSTSARVAAMEEFRGSDTYLGGRMESIHQSCNEVISNDNRDGLTTTTRIAESFETVSSPHLLSPKRKLHILLSTDLAARGLDIADITHVINYDLPREGDTYVHRGGRAGRFGRKGLVMSIVTAEQEFVLDRLANKLGLDVKCMARQRRQSKSDD